MSDTVRGVIIFFAVIATILTWAPLRGSAQPRVGGGTLNKIYCGVFNYLTIHSEMKEPDFKIRTEWHPPRVGATIGLTGAVWAGVYFWLKKSGKTSDREAAREAPAGTKPIN